MIFWAYVLSGDIPYKNFWRALIYAPRIIGGVVLGFLWRFIFQNVFVQFGNWTGIKWFAQQWFTTPESSFWALVIVMTWSLSGYLMIIYNSGLAAISKDYYEAATVDGASKLTILKSITLPLLKEQQQGVCLLLLTGQCFYMIRIFLLQMVILTELQKAL